MSKINGMMDVGRRSMMNSQTALQTVGHNIANKNTEGFSRQRVEQVTNVPSGIGKLRIGTGARASDVTRVNNPYLEKQLNKEVANLGYMNSKADSMWRVEQVYNEQSNKGLNTFITDFFNAFRELANNPESLATRNLVKETGDHLTKDFKRVNNQLSEIQNDLDQQILANVEEVNAMSKEIAGLNEKIAIVETSGGHANDERDRRDFLIKKMGEKINIRWAEGDGGIVTISAGNSALIVTGFDSKELMTMRTPEAEGKGEGCFDIFYKNNEQAVPFKVTEQFNGGSIGALLEVRDQVIGDLFRNMDEMAFGLSTHVNELHKLGFDTYNKQGLDFFKIPDATDPRHAASLFKVNEKIMNDVNKIAVASDPFAPGDNRVANEISSLQFDRIMGGVATLDDYYNSVVGEAGITAQRANTARQAQTDIVKQLQNIRESVSGVSLDEETAKMIEFQKAFDASARLIRTADEMLDTVLNLKRY